jgi:hypothetical protein
MQSFFAYVALVEYAREFIWNEGRLNKLYYENHNRLKGCNNTISNTWFMDDNMVLKTTLNEIELKGRRELSISISEEEKNDSAMRPLRIDLER